MASCTKTSLILLLMLLHRSENKAAKYKSNKTTKSTTNFINPLHFMEESSLETWESVEASKPNTTLYTLSPPVPGSRINDTEYDMRVQIPKGHQHPESIFNQVQLDGINDVRYQYSPEHTGTIIVLHPQGEFGVSWKAFTEVCTPEFRFRCIKVIYPSAPRRRYSLANGELHYIWFDEWDNTPYSPEKLTTFQPSFEGIDEIMQQEFRNNITEDRIIIGGMGMGGEMALHLAYTRYTNLRGVFALSTHLKNNSIVYKTLAERKQTKVPYLYACYNRDGKYSKLKWARDTYKNLKRLGVPGEFHNTPIFALPYATNCPAFDKVYAWVVRILTDDSFIDEITIERGQWEESKEVFM